jgi:phosphatidylserine/phosphatidylglycerophosphate/cardiolipin synthase-like enzyme
LVLNPEIYYSQLPSGGRDLLSTNHIKLTAIDQGAYWIAGGCALRPFWCNVTGAEHLEKLKHGFFDFYNPLEAKGFRDMDFMFKSPAHGAGMTAFLEGAKLMLRYAHMQNPELAQQLKQQFLTLMQLPASNAEVPSFDANPERINDQFGMKLYSTGPDHNANSYLKALIDLINNAQEKIVIGHMYFHPPQKLIDALAQASERGVRIEIITNSKDNEAPLAHRFFSDLAQVKYQQLFESPGHENVKVHEFYRANVTYHKKVIIVDDRYTAFGSTNLGTKSIEENPDDYEFNCITDSTTFAAKTMSVLQQDIHLSNEVPPQIAKNPTWDTRLLGFFQEHVMTHIL